MKSGKLHILLITLVVAVLHFAAMIVVLFSDEPFERKADFGFIYQPGRWMVVNLLQDDALTILRPLMLPFTSLVWGLVAAGLYGSCRLFWKLGQPVNQ